MKLNNCLLGVTALAAFGFAAANASAEEITIATVNNNDMIVMQGLAPKWEEATGNTINWVVLEENVLRQRTTQDISTNGGSFDIMFIGAYETPIWGANGWLTSLNDFGDDADYDLERHLPAGAQRPVGRGQPLRRAAVLGNVVHVLPYGSVRKGRYSSRPTEQPTYDEFRDMAAKLHDPDNGVYGTCQRGKAGWGENMAFVGTMANAFGARWFDMDWKPQLDSQSGTTRSPTTSI